MLLSLDIKDEFCMSSTLHVLCLYGTIAMLYSPYDMGEPTSVPMKSSVAVKMEGSSEMTGS